MRAMIDPKEIAIKTEKTAKEMGRFVIEPLPSGYGYTLGNALRRVLLSSLPGAAVAEVRFEGVSHPFTTIKGVEEDVIELILNLKKVRFISHVDEPLEGQIEAKGKGRVTAGDIKISAGAEVANPKLNIATLTDRSAKLSAKILVVKGFGYNPSEERKGSKVGAIPIDSVFSPVTKVAYWVEETRRGRETNLDKLIIELTTDGTIKPREALEKAATILAAYLKPITGKKLKEEIPPAEKGEKAKVPSPKIRKLSLSDLNLSPQIVTILSGSGIKTVGGLLRKPRKELLAIRGFGEQRLVEIDRELRKLGVALKEDESSKED